MFVVIVPEVRHALDLQDPQKTVADQVPHQLDVDGHRRLVIILVLNFNINGNTFNDFQK